MDIPDVAVDCVAGARVVCIYEAATDKGWEVQYPPKRGTVHRIIQTEFHTYVCIAWDDGPSTGANELSITAWWSQASGCHTQDRRSGFSLEKDEERMRAHLRFLTLQDLQAKASKMWAAAAAVDKIVRECTPKAPELSIEERRSAMRGKWNYSPGDTMPFHPIHGDAFEIPVGVRIMSRKFIVVNKKTGEELGPSADESGHTMTANSHPLYKRTGTDPATPGTPVWDELQRMVAKGIESLRLTHFYGVHEQQKLDGTVSVKIRGAHYTPPA